MADSNWHQIETIIDRALNLPEAEQRRFIKQQCGEDTQLEGEVTLLLKSISDSEGWLEDPGNYKKEFYEEMAEDVQLLSADRSLEGTRVGAYIIREELGQGGMGTVYRAERADSSFDHQVAIKMIRSGRATQENIQRFRHEQRILAGLNHPGIARLYNGGVTEDGVPYIIMEYVDGTPIDDYCKKNACGLAQKISLFEEVLQALRYAHENLVIHRDLKPDNILVDQDGNIKILDFGISKLRQENEDHNLTQTGAHLLTPRYAAPEQITQQNITTATDLYALGMVFYQLLAGMHPFDFEGLSRYEMGETILNKQPPKPGKKVASPALAKKLQGDLDAIALKAIRKEPDKRYRVADTFLEDLKNYQHGLPVSARKDTTRYRSQKFFQRHRQGVAIATGIVLLLITVVGFYSYRITQERNQAEMEAEKAKQVTKFLANIFKSNDPEISKGDTLTAYALLNKGLDRIDHLETPEVHAEMLIIIGNAYLSLGFEDKAEHILDRAITENRTIYGKQSAELAEALFARGKAETLNFDIALPFFRKSYNIRKALWGENNPATLSSMTQLATSMRNVAKLDSAEYFAKKAYQFNIENFKGDSLNLIDPMGILAYIYRKQNKYAKGKKLNLEIIKVLEKSESHENDLELAYYYNNLAFIYRDLKEYINSEKYLRKSLDINEKIRGHGHATTLIVRGNLASNMRYQGKYDEEYSLLKQNLKFTQKKYSVNHWRTASKYETLGKFLIRRKRYTEAETYLNKGIDIYSGALGINHIWTACAEGILAANLYFENKKEKADNLFTISFKKLKQEAPNFRPFNKGQVRYIIKLYENESKEKYTSQITSLNTLLDNKI